jgi:hypothetical protein
MQRVRYPRGSAVVVLAAVFGAGLADSPNRAFAAPTPPPTPFIAPGSPYGGDWYYSPYGRFTMTPEHPLDSRLIGALVPTLPLNITGYIDGSFTQGFNGLHNDQMLTVNGFDNKNGSFQFQDFNLTAYKPVLLGGDSWDYGLKVQYNMGYDDKLLGGLRNKDQYNLTEANITIASPYKINFTAGQIPDLFSIESVNRTQGPFSSLDLSASRLLIEPRYNTVAVLTGDLGNNRSLTGGVSEKPNYGLADCCCDIGSGVQIQAVDRRGTDLNGILQYRSIQDNYRYSVGAEIGPMGGPTHDNMQYLLNTNGEFEPTSKLRLGWDASVLWGERGSSSTIDKYFNGEENFEAYMGYQFCPYCEGIGRTGFFHSDKGLLPQTSNTITDTFDSGSVNVWDVDLGLIWTPFADKQYFNTMQLIPQFHYQDANKRVFGAGSAWQTSYELDLRFQF